MRDEQLQTTEQVNQFLEWSEALEFRGIITEEKYRWMEEALSSGTFKRQSIYRKDGESSFQSLSTIHKIC